MGTSPLHTSESSQGVAEQQNSVFGHLTSLLSRSTGTDRAVGSTRETGVDKGDMTEVTAKQTLTLESFHPGVLSNFGDCLYFGVVAWF